MRLPRSSEFPVGSSVRVMGQGVGRVVAHHSAYSLIVELSRYGSCAVSVTACEPDSGEESGETPGWAEHISA